MSDVHQEEGASNAEAGCSGLAVRAAATGRDGDVKAVDQAGERERCENSVLQAGRGEIFLKWAPVDFDFAGAGSETDTGDCRFAAACGAVSWSSCHRCVYSESELERGDRDGLLGSVRMLCTRIHFELGEDVAPQAIVGDHSLHSVLNEEFRMARTALFEVFRVVTAHETREAHIGLGFLFFARDADFVGIDHNDEIAGVNVGSENGLLLAAHEVGCLRGDASKNLVLGVNDPPVALHFVGFG